MDFEATGWLERNYKWLVATIIMFISVSGLFYYLSLKDKSDTFIAASLYALCLFAAGIYMNYMSNTIADKLQDRIEIYLNLQRVCGSFKAFIDEKYSDYEATRLKIISFQVFTSRAESMKEEEIVPYIRQRGIKFNAKELEIENVFLELYSTLSKSITDTIVDYIKINNISISCRNVIIRDIFSFEPELWCKEHLSDYENDGRKMVNHIYAKLNDLKDEYSKLELLNKKVSKLYSNYLFRAKLNIRQIEKMYGRKLQFIISHQHEIQENFDSLFQLLKEMEDRIEIQISKHDAKIESYVECLEQISTSIYSLCSDADEIKDIVLGLND